MVPAGQGDSVYEEGQAQFVHDGVEFDVGVQGADQQPGEQHARRTQAEAENADAADQEAEQQRKLLNLRTTVDAIAELDSPKNIELFDKLGILNERELVARQEIMYDIYFKTVNIEGETTQYMAQTQVLPAALSYLAELGDIKVKSRAVEGLTEEVRQLTDQLYDALQTLREENTALGGEEVHEKAHHMRDAVLPAMGRVRDAADSLESVVSVKHWTLPTYRQMLFVK